MTFREKHLWISIISTVLVWGFYYVHLFQEVAGGALSNPRFGWMLGAFFIGCLVTSVAIEVVLTVLASLTTRKAEREARDEREMLASLNAMNGKKERLIEIAADGKISNDEIDDFIHIRQELERISLTVETLQLWTERMLANGQIDAETYKRKLED